MKKSDHASSRRAAWRATARTARTTAPDADRPPPPRQQRPDEEQAGLDLDRRPERRADARARTASSSQRQPSANRRNRSGPTCPSLIAYRNGHDSPASRTIPAHRPRDGEDHDADRESGDREADPQPGRGRRGEQRRTAGSAGRRWAGSRTGRSRRRPGTTCRRAAGRRGPGPRPRGRRGSRSRASALRTRAIAATTRANTSDRDGGSSRRQRRRQAHGPPGRSGAADRRSGAR